MQGEYLAAFNALLEEFMFYLREHHDELGRKEKAAGATLYFCYLTHMRKLAEGRTRALAGEHGVPFEQLEMAALGSAFDSDRQDKPIRCYRGYQTPEDMKQCPFAWRLDYLVLNEDEFRRLGVGRDG